MTFLFIIPSIPGALGNFLVPIMVGAKDVAFPKLNLLSLYLYWIGALFTLSSHHHRRRRHRLDVLRALFERQSRAWSRSRTAASFEMAPKTKC